MRASFDLSGAQPVPITNFQAYQKRARQGMLGLLTAALSLAGCGVNPQARLPPVISVEVADVLQKDVPVQHEWIGTLDGLVHAHVHPQVTGYLMTRCYKEGALVKKGDLMFEIDARPFQAVLDQALAKLGKDELDVNRLKPLAMEKAVSQQELDDAMQAYMGDKAAVDQAAVNLSFTKVMSPIDGLSGLSKAEIGDLVGPNTEELTTVSTVDPIKAYFTISEEEYLHHVSRLIQRDSSAHSAGPPLDLILADGSLYPHKGEFYATDNQLDARTGALRIAALFPNPGNTLLPGQFGRVRMTEVRAGALVVPQRAVMELQGTYQVAVVGQDNMVRIRAVKIGERTGALWIVTEGLKTGEHIVVEGVQKVSDGAVVNPTPFADKSATNSMQVETR